MRTKIFVIFLVFFITSSLSLQAENTEYLIPDIQLRTIVNSKLSKDSTYSATVDELSNLTGFLQLQGSSNNLIKFESLEGLQYLDNIHYLEFIRTIIEPDDLKYFKEMDALTHLRINHTFFSGNEAVTSVNKTSINGGSIADVEHIDITQNIDLSPIGQIDTLTDLDISVNGFKEMSQHSYAPRTKYLFSGLENLSNLSRLTLSLFGDTDDNSFSWIENLTNLTQLTIIEGSLDDVTAISKLPKLTKLNITSTYVTDLTPIVDKPYFSGASYMSAILEEQYYNNSELGNILSLNNLFKFKGTETSNLSVNISSNFKDYVSFNRSVFSDLDLSLDFNIISPKVFYTYNYITGEYDIKRFGFNFGFESESHNNKAIEYNSITVPIGKKVSFDENYDNKEPIIKYMNPFKPIETLSVTRDGYSFLGWYTDVNLTNLYDFDNQSTENIYLYAKWEPFKDDVDELVVLIHYIDDQGNKLLDSKAIFGKKGEAYSTVQEAIEGYNFKLVHGATEGLFTEESIEVTYIYEKIID